MSVSVYVCVCVCVCKNKILATIDYLLFARDCAKCFVWIISFHLPDNSMGWQYHYPHFTDKEN